MQLDYLLFDASDEEDGACSFDAMASVQPAHIAALAKEVAAVLAWADRSFGPPRSIEDGGEWDYDLQAVDDENGDVPLPICYDFSSRELAMPPARGRVTVSLTLTGSRGFAQAFREVFGEAD